MESPDQREHDPPQEDERVTEDSGPAAAQVIGTDAPLIESAK